MQRLLSVALVLGLLVATAAAFAVTENLKLTKSPITRTQVPVRAFSPVCHCSTRSATLAFWLRKGDVLTLDVVKPGGAEVARLVDETYAHPKWNTFHWDGRTNDGTIAPDGRYQFKVHLKDAHRTILLPNKLVLDTKPPKVLRAHPNRDTFAPGNGHVKIRYRLSESAHALLFVKLRRVVRTRFAPRTGSLDWYGTVDGQPLPQGTYVLRVGAEDLAGNLTGPRQGKPVVVHIRYITLARHSLRVRAGFRFGVGVETAAGSFRWHFAGKTGTATSGLLVLRAPKKPGSYALRVREDGHGDRMTVVVVRR